MRNSVTRERNIPQMIMTYCCISAQNDVELCNDAIRISVTATKTQMIMTVCRFRGQNYEKLGDDVTLNSVTSGGKIIQSMLTSC